MSQEDKDKTKEFAEEVANKLLGKVKCRRLRGVLSQKRDVELRGAWRCRLFLQEMCKTIRGHH